MPPSRAFLIALVLCLAASPAFAQEEDLLAPLTPTTDAKTKGKTKPKPAPKKPPAKVAKTPKKGKKPGKGAKEAADAELLAPLEDKKPALLVKLSGVVRGVHVLVDDKEVGPVSKGPVEVEPGEHTLLVRKPGFRDFSQRFTATANQVTELAVQLEATMGFVSVRSDVPGSRVFIDGEDRGTVPLEGIPLPAGSHEISVQQKGFNPERRNIAVRVGKDYTIDAEMRPARVAVAASDEPRVPVLTPSAPPPAPTPLAPGPPTVASSTPLTQRWYFWAGVGAVVAAAAVGTVVATQPLDSGKVCGGACDGVINPPHGLFH